MPGWVYNKEGRSDGWIDGCVDVWMDAWMYGWISVWSVVISLLGSYYPLCVRSGRTEGHVYYFSLGHVTLIC